MKKYKSVLRESVNLNKLLSIAKSEGFKISSYNKPYPGEEKEYNIIKRYILSQHGIDDMFLYQTKDGGYWTSDPYFGDQPIKDGREFSKNISKFMDKY